MLHVGRALEMESTFIFPHGCLQPYLCFLFLITASHVVIQSRGYSSHLLGARQEMRTDSKGEELSRNLRILPMVLGFCIGYVRAAEGSQPGSPCLGTQQVPWMFSQDLSSDLTLLLIRCVALAPLKSIELMGVQSGTTPTEDSIKTIKAFTLWPAG